MRATFPLYDGDRVIHYSGSVSLPGTERIEPRRKTFWARLGSAVAAFFEWLERSAERARYREIERYLGESTDLYDLERRIREIERTRNSGFDPYA